MTEAVFNTNPSEYPYKVFEGSLIDYIKKISFNNMIYPAQVEEAAGDIASLDVNLQDQFCQFSNAVGVELYSKGCMPPAAEAFKMALLQQQDDDKRDPIIKTYSKNYINAIASHIYALDQAPKDIASRNIQWFLQELPYFETAIKYIEIYNDNEADKTVRNTLLTVVKIITLHTT